jgi:hypothetical protein
MELGTAQLKLANLGIKRLTARITFGSFFLELAKLISVPISSRGIVHRDGFRLLNSIAVCLVTVG